MSGNELIAKDSTTMYRHVVPCLRKSCHPKSAFQKI